MRAGVGPLRYFHRNQQYSVVALTDSTGSINERYNYDAYGTLTISDANGVVRTASVEGNRYTYTGRELDEILGLYHFRARVYDSVNGRFCSRDSIGYKDGNSLYSAFFAFRGTDAFGHEWTVAPYTPSKPRSPTVLNPAGRSKGNICAASMLDHHGEPNDRWNKQADDVGHYVRHGIASRQDLLDFVKENRCCSLYTFGHQGGYGNASGTVTYPGGPEDKPVVIIPTVTISRNRTLVHSEKNKEFLKLLFSHCITECFLNVVACGADTEKHRQARQRIADETGCTVCSSSRTISLGGNLPGSPNGVQSHLVDVNASNQL